MTTSAFTALGDSLDVLAQRLGGGIRGGGERSDRYRFSRGGFMKMVILLRRSFKCGKMASYSYFS